MSALSIVHSPVSIIHLTEQQPLRLVRAALNEADAELIWTRYGKQIDLREPSRHTQQHWQLLSDGWVGIFPIHSALRIQVQPKVPLQSLFGMWDYVYDLDLLISRRELYDCDTVAEFYSHLALALAQRVLDRVRKGLMRTYVPHEARLPYLAGRLLTLAHAQSPWRADLPCAYEEHSPDTIDNQIMAWALYVILSSGECTEPAQTLVRRAYRAMLGAVSVQPISPAACVGRSYDRLNADYRPIHVLSRFFLEHISPSHWVGERSALPFQVDMSRLFERFVAAWLRKHLPPQLQVAAQERVEIGESGEMYFKIDLVIRQLMPNALDSSSFSSVRCVLDTKYKASPTPAPSDIQQIVTYAELKGCRDGVLIYPTPMTQAAFNIGNKRISALAFDLSHPIALAGAGFLQQLWRALQ